MSLELFDDEIQRKFTSIGGTGAGGRSVHEHSSAMLLFPHTSRTEEDSNGKTTTTKELDVEGRTEYPSPANSTALKFYGQYYLEKEFGTGRGSGMVTVHNYYSTMMLSKNRKSRQEYTIVAAASALNGGQDKPEDIMKKLQEA